MYTVKPVAFWYQHVSCSQNIDIKEEIRQWNLHSIYNSSPTGNKSTQNNSKHGNKVC